MKALNEEPVPPRKIRRKCPRDLDVICMKCLQRDPKKRYATAGELAEDLQRYQEGEPIRARPPGRLAALRNALRRRKEFLYFVAGVLTAALVFGGLLWLKERRASNGSTRGSRGSAVCSIENGGGVVQSLVTRDHEQVAP